MQGRTEIVFVVKLLLLLLLLLLQEKKKKHVICRLRSVRIVKNCDPGLENAALGLRSRVAFSSPRSQFFTILTSQPANNIYLLYGSFLPHGMTYVMLWGLGFGGEIRLEITHSLC